MGKNRFFYLASLGAGMVFYLAYREWMSWLLLLGLLCLPVMSLLVSLPALLTLKLRFHCPSHLLPGEEAAASVTGRCPFPMPFFGCRILVRRLPTGEVFKLKMGQSLPTDHCGALCLGMDKAWAYDYLGLFRFYLSNIPEVTAIVRPEQIPVEQLPQLHRQLATAWRPKPGGGYAENHELRLYRPGDQLRQIHWKLSAKTGDLIIREPMIPQGRQAVVTVCVTGTPEVLDVKFGRLLGACNRLLSMDVPYEIAAMTGDGLRVFPVQKEQQLWEALDLLLAATPTAQEQAVPFQGAWAYRIGGDGHD